MGDQMIFICYLYALYYPDLPKELFGDIIEHIYFGLCYLQLNPKSFLTTLYNWLV